MSKTRWEIVLTVVVYIASLAFQYGVFSQRISALESNIQDIKTDIHEMRQHVAWKN